MPEFPGSILGADMRFSFFFLVEKNSMIVKKYLSFAKIVSTVYKMDTRFAVA